MFQPVFFCLCSHAAVLGKPGEERNWETPGILVEHPAGENVKIYSLQKTDHAEHTTGNPTWRLAYFKRYLKSITFR